MMRLRTGRTGLLALLSLCLLTWTPGDSRAATERRVALVVGNSSYKNALKLPTVAFADKAGSFASDGDGQNSPFTTAPAKNLATPGLNLRIALGRVRDDVLPAPASKQESFVYGRGTAVAVVPPLPDPIDVAPAPAPAPVVDIQAEMRRAYEAASQVGTKEAWDQFLTFCTSGFYAVLARSSRDKIIAEEARAAAAAAKAEADSKAAKLKTEAEAKVARAEARAAAKAEAKAKVSQAKRRSSRTQSSSRRPSSHP
jgi:hypothetical protein